MGKKRIWHLSGCHPSTKKEGWRAFIMWWFSRPKFRVLSLKIRRWKTQMERKSSKKCSDSFCGQTRAFHHEIVFRGIQPCFLRGDQSAWLVLNQPRQRGFWRNVRYFLVKESTSFKGNFCIYKGFMDVSYILTLAWKKKPENVHLKLIFFCHALSRFNLGERIQDPVGVIRKLLFRIDFWVFQ